MRELSATFAQKQSNSKNGVRRNAVKVAGVQISNSTRIVRTMTERLERIERVLEVLANNQVAERESRLALREDIEILYQIAQQTGGRLDQVAARVDQLTIQVGELSRLMAQSIETANADRAAIRETQAETRRIWMYLLGQQPNGHGESI